MDAQTITLEIQTLIILGLFIYILGMVTSMLINGTRR